MINEEEIPRKKEQARRIVDFHKNRIADFVHGHASDPQNRRPFRFGLTNGVDATPQHQKKLPPRPNESDSGEDRRGFLIDKYHTEAERGPLAVGGCPVHPPVRLRRPQDPGPISKEQQAAMESRSGSSSGGGFNRMMTAMRRKESPRRLPPIVYDAIENVMDSCYLPTSWFDDKEQEPARSGSAGVSVSSSKAPLESRGSDGSRADSKGMSDRKSASERSSLSLQATQEPSQPAPSPEWRQLQSEDKVQYFTPPFKAKSKYAIHGEDRHEWRACEVLGYCEDTQLYLMQWSFGNMVKKKVSALMLMMDGETEEEAEERHTQARQRRDLAESSILERLVVEELSQWENVALQQEASGSSPLQKILQNTRHERWGGTNGGGWEEYKNVDPTDSVLDSLVQEVKKRYCEAQARSILLFHRPDLPSNNEPSQQKSYQEEVPSAKPSVAPTPKPPKNERMNSRRPVSRDARSKISTPRTKQRAKVPGMQEPDVAASSSAGKQDTHRSNQTSQQKSSEKDETVSPAAVNLDVDGDDHVAPFKDKVTRLGARILTGQPAQAPRLSKVFDICAEIISDVSVFQIGSKQEPYSLMQITRYLMAKVAKHYASYRISWPDRITKVFLRAPVPARCDRTLNLVAMKMEACLHELCLSNLRCLVDLTERYAKLSRDVQQNNVSLTYVPPAVYQRDQETSYYQHPLFRVSIFIENGDSNFDCDVELKWKSFLLLPTLAPSKVS
jgi:hypothetical protein